MNKPTIFISHITSEKELAISLKKFIEKQFLGILDVFVSSHENSIKLGDDWLGRIKQSMEDCILIIVICSPNTITRSWIFFESGAGWIKNIPVIPLCHSGLSPAKLPVPLNSFQGGLINSKDDIKNLFSRLADLLEINIPDSSNSDFFDKINDSIKKLAAQLSNNTVSPNSEIIELKDELKSVKDELKNQSIEIINLIRNITSENDKRSVKSITFDLEKLDGVWYDQHTETKLYIKFKDSVLLMPYSFGGRNYLTAHYINCRLIGDTIYAKFKWLRGREISGYAIYEIKDENNIVGGWWMDEDIPFDFHDETSSQNFYNKSNMEKYRYTMSPAYFVKVSELKNLPSEVKCYFDEEDRDFIFS